MRFSRSVRFARTRRWAIVLSAAQEGARDFRTLNPPTVFKLSATRESSGRSE